MVHKRLWVAVDINMSLKKLIRRAEITWISHLAPGMRTREIISNSDIHERQTADYVSARKKKKND